MKRVPDPGLADASFTGNDLLWDGYSNIAF